MERSELESHTKSPLNITALLHELEAGQPAALNRLVEVAYPELKRIAHRQCGRERQSSTLQCTAVVHEAWLRLAQAQHTTWKDRAHFFAFASHLMRSILIDYARARKSAKRGGGTPALTLIDTDAVTPPQDVEILELDAALEELEKLDSLQARIVELRYFSGLTIQETAEAVGVSDSTVNREWVIAKTWLRRRLLGGKNEP